MASSVLTPHPRLYPRLLRPCMTPVSPTKHPPLSTTRGQVSHSILPYIPTTISRRRYLRASYDQLRSRDTRRQLSRPKPYLTALPLPLRIYVSGLRNRQQRPLHPPQYIKYLRRLLPMIPMTSTVDAGPSKTSSSPYRVATNRRPMCPLPVIPLPWTCSTTLLRTMTRLKYTSNYCHLPPLTALHHHGPRPLTEATSNSATTSPSPWLLPASPFPAPCLALRTTGR